MVKFVVVAVLEDCCMAFANVQVSELWPIPLVFIFYVFILLLFRQCTLNPTKKKRKKNAEHLHDIAKTCLYNIDPLNPTFIY